MVDCRKFADVVFSPALGYALYSCTHTTGQPVFQGEVWRQHSRLRQMRRSPDLRTAQDCCVVKGTCRQNLREDILTECTHAGIRQVKNNEHGVGFAPTFPVRTISFIAEATTESSHLDEPCSKIGGRYRGPNAGFSPELATFCRHVCIRTDC